jgi:glycine cleavage system aminomethyltransferase T
MSLMASFLVQGQDAGTVLSRLSANNVTAGLRSSAS